MFEEEDKGIGYWIGEIAFWLGILLAFSKTAELMAAFAPRRFFMFEGVEGIYGILCALMIEGLFVAMKYDLQRGSGTERARYISAAFAVGAWAFSFAAQFFDSFVIAGKIGELPAELQWFLTYFVPSTPITIAGAIALVRGLNARKRKAGTQDADDYPFPKQIGGVKKPGASSGMGVGVNGRDEKVSGGVPEMVERASPKA